IGTLPNIRRLTAETEYEYIEGQDGGLQSAALSAQFGVEFNARDHVAVTYSRDFERLEESFFIRSNAEIPAADYAFSTIRLSGETDSSRRLYGSARASTGGFFNGNRTDIGGMIGYRQSRHLHLEGNLSHSMIDLPVSNGTFDATTMSLSILGAASRKLFARALVQYDNFSRDLAANI